MRNENVDNSVYLLSTKIKNEQMDFILTTTYKVDIFKIYHQSQILQLLFNKAKIQFVLIKYLNINIPIFCKNIQLLSDIL